MLDKRKIFSISIMLYNVGNLPIFFIQYFEKAYYTNVRMALNLSLFTSLW